MDASTSVPQPSDESAPPLDPDLRDLLSIASSVTHALSESGAFDDLTERQAEGVESAMQLIAQNDPAARRIAYLQLLDLLLHEPERFRDALISLHDRLAAAELPTPSDRWSTFETTADAILAEAASRTPLDALVVSPRVAHDARLLPDPPVTRWIDGTLYIGASTDQFYRVVTIDYDREHERAFLTTASYEQWLVLLPELAASRAA